MKKGIIAVVLLLCLSLFGCSNKIKDEDCYRIGQKFENKSIGLRLNDASFAIALESVYNPSKGKYASGYFKPNNSKISGAFVAPGNCTLVYMDISLSNPSGRGSIEYDGSYTNTKYTRVYVNRIIYKGVEYDKYAISKLEKRIDQGTSNYLTYSGAGGSFRCYVTIPVEVDDLNDSFYIEFETIPAGSDNGEKFIFKVEH